jgi:hypothetical protein
MLSSYIHESKSPNISYRAQHDGIAWRYTGSMPLRHAKYDTQKSSRSGNGNDGVPQRWYEQPRERSIRGRAAPKTTTPVHPCTAHKYSMQRSTSFPRCQTREQCGISQRERSDSGRSCASRPCKSSWSGLCTPFPSVRKLVLERHGS